MPWRFEWHTTWDDVWREPALAAWRTCYAAAGERHPFQHPDVCRAWAETVAAAEGAAPLLGLGQDDAGRSAVCAWCVTATRGRFARRRNLGPMLGAHACYSDPLLAGPDVAGIDWQGFWQTAQQGPARHYDAAQLRFVRPELLAGLPSIPCGQENPILDLEDGATLDSLLARAAGSHRGDVKRQLRRLESRGTVRLWRPGADEVAAAAADFDVGFCPAYDALWDGRPEGNLLRRPGQREFLRRWVSQGLAEGWGDYSVLQVAGQAIAWHAGLRDRGNWYWMAPTHDQQWSNLSPGKLALALLLPQAAGEGCQAFHMLTGGHAYKRAWNPRPHDLRAVSWHAGTWRGRLFKWYDRRAQGVAHE
jgi:CelD/BcsL family acetyltransferase involved in cellulose biosynthesis